MAQVQLNMAIMDSFQPFLGHFFAQPLAYRVPCFVLLLRLLSYLHIMGHKTGTRRNQVKNTRLPPQNSGGALA